MSVIIDALYVLDDQNECVVEHVYHGRPPQAHQLITSLAGRPSPRPAVNYLADLHPPTTTYSITSGNLSFVAAASRDPQSLAVLDFLNRFVDILEDFLGSPLLRGKIEDNYEVVAQLLGEVCDGGIISNTEPNALRESVEVSSLIGKLFTQVGLPGTSPALGPQSSFASSIRPSPIPSNGPAIPWRKPNVRHTSNELYVDIVESLSVILAPSGRPISARCNGSIAFTAKISGVPDLLLTLSAPGGTSTAKTSGILRTMQLPVFHPCVRLARWKEHAGEISFVPPDGRFMLAGYETDLMPLPLDSGASPDQASSSSEKIFLPATVDLRAGLGPSGMDFEARAILNNHFPGVPGSSSGKSGSSRSTSLNAGPFSFGGASGSTGSSAAPTLEAVVVTIPFPQAVRAVTELKPSRGEASFNAMDKTVEWRIPTKDGASVNGVAVLSGTVTGPLGGNVNGAQGAAADGDNGSDVGDAEDADRSNSQGEDESRRTTVRNGHNTPRKRHPSRTLMPRSIAVSFSVKGWLPSGIKVDALLVDAKKSKGLGDGVRPYKGVKYITVSRRGVERRVD
ncbi:hypothetical protein PV10_00190 [Exophiala mesophila]|uniref:MHD domain-containing protein n=1 Tax=Exophiala mesophila TaxID=212818 RepID=A0A0D2ABK6_EXOME|nr:uncharacterized protein PV10_00190 [Exophiala mesophila]KIV96308.1 hypothetical protein PV10_00190 [Exophiala mesophila]